MNDTPYSNYQRSSNVPPATHKKQTFGEWVTENEKQILLGAVVLLAIKNRKLRRRNIELVSRLNETHQMLDKGQHLLHHLADAIENPNSIFTEYFASKS